MMSKMALRVAVVSALLAGLAGAAGYAWSVRARQDAAPASLETVVIATNTAYVAMCPIVAAQERGYFVQHGINAQIQSHNSGKAALEAALQGRAHLGTVADIPVMFAVLEQAPVAVVATIFRAEKDHGVAARRDRGINGLAELKGKRIGVPLSTSAHFVLNAMLNRQHLAASEVTMVNYKPDELADALRSGEVDAVSLWEPYLDAMRAQLGANGALFYADDLYEIPYNLAGSKEYVVSHPGTIRKLLRALIDGASYCRNEPASAQAMTAAVMKSGASKWRELWPTYRFNVSLDQALLLALEDETRWAMSSRLVANGPLPNYLNAIDLQPLKAVAPAAVTVIH